MFKMMLSALVLLVLSFTGIAQSIVALENPETGSPDHCARILVHLKPGYSYLPSAGQMMHAYISPSCGVETHLYYGELKKKMDGGIYRVSKEKIYLKYWEEYNAKEFKFFIYNFDKTVLYDQSNVTVTNASGYGNNQIEISLAGLSLPNKYYTLEVINDKNEKWYLRFIIQ